MGAASSVTLGDGVAIRVAGLMGHICSWLPHSCLELQEKDEHGRGGMRVERREMSMRGMRMGGRKMSMRGRMKVEGRKMRVRDQVGRERYKHGRITLFF